MYHIHRIILLGTLILFVAGCGGDDREPLEVGKTKESTVNPTNVAGANKPRPLAVGKTQKKPTQSANQKRRSSKEPEEDALPPGTDPDDVFVTDAKFNTFDVSATPEEQATFSIFAKPVAGADSNTFEWPALGSGRRPAETRITPYKRPPRISVETGEAEGTLDGLPEGFIIARSSTTHESGLPTRIQNKLDNSEFVLIPAGNTIRGSNTGPANARPAHQVHLDSYYISVNEVTLYQWELFREAERENDRLRQTTTPLNDGAGPDMPVLGIPQLEARKYAEWLHCELPTEAQWEKAARGPEGFVYPWGNGRPIWSAPRKKNEIRPVMSWRNDVSTYGVYDLAGNAREWTLDVYRDDYYAFEAGENGEKLVENPTGPKAGAGAYDRVIRGGGDDWHIWHREQARFSEKLPDVGFRLVVNLTTSKPPAETPENGRTRPRR